MALVKNKSRNINVEMNWLNINVQINGWDYPSFAATVLMWRQMAHVKNKSVKINAKKSNKNAKINGWD